MSRLAIYRGDQFLEEVVLSRAVMGLGRHPENDIVLDDKTLSRFHARVERRGDRFVVVDLGAQNGVHLNGTRIVGESNLAPGDRIELGRYIAVFEPVRKSKNNEDIDIDVALDDDELDSDRTKNVRPEKGNEKPERKGHEPVLVLLFNGMEVSRHPVVQGGVSVGRSKTCDVVISLLGLSRKHATVTPADDGTVVVEDMGSQNGTWVNNQRIQGAKKLRHGDLLNFYDYAVLYLEDGSVDVGFPGAGFKAPANGDNGHDDLSSQETNRSQPSPGPAPEKGGRGAGKSPVPLADSAADRVAVDGGGELQSAKSQADLDLGEGSFLEDFEEKSGSSSLLDGDVLDDPLEGLEGIAGDTNAGAERPRKHNTTDVAARPPASKPSAEQAADEFADVSGTEGDAFKFDERTSAAMGTDGNAKSAWPSDKDLLKALSNAPESGLVQLEVTLGGRPYTQIALSQTVTRVGTDPRCELSLPKSSGLAAWHLTLLHLGGSVVIYRAARSGQILLAEAAIDSAVLQDGDMLDLGKVRLKLRMR